MKKLNFFLCVIFTLLLFPISTFAQTPTVEFKCNMSVQIKRGTFNPAADSIWVRGNFTDWAGKDFMLTDQDGDSIYSTVNNNFTLGQSLVFKYVHSPDTWESTGNRTLIVVSGANLTSTCWNDSCVFIPTKTIQVTFTVNMELERLSGLFNPQTDSVSVRGSFNGWESTWMRTIPNHTDVYRITTPVIAAIDDKINFKFFYSPGTWEENNLTDGTQNDRYFIVTQAVYDSGFMAYDAIGFNNASFPQRHPLKQKFKIECNTNGAKILNTLNGTEFQTLHILGVPSNPESIENFLPDSIKSIQLYDDGTNGDLIAGDKVFSVDTVLTFLVWDLLPPRWGFIINYQYSANYNLPSNGGSNFNEITGGGYHHTILELDIDTTFIDTFGIVNITKVERDIKTPTTFKLDQNFPNPFNPETKISWQIAVGTFVTLKIYDILGNEIATLVNEEQHVGTYQVSFNQQQLASGIYFYQLHAGNFVQTKKMILLR